MMNTTSTGANLKGHIVILPCGDVGTASKVVGRDVYVVHADRGNGAGPWIYSAASLEIADDGTADEYTKRCDRYDWSRDKRR